MDAERLIAAHERLHELALKVLACKPALAAAGWNTGDALQWQDAIDERDAARMAPSTRADRMQWAGEEAAEPTPAKPPPATAEEALREVLDADEEWRLAAEAGADCGPAVGRMIEARLAALAILERTPGEGGRHA